MVEDWDLIAYMLECSTLPNLRLRDIVQNLDVYGLCINEIEPIMRRDLLNRFLDSLLYLRRKRKEVPMKWEITFHCTKPENVPNIIQKGFLLSMSRHGTAGYGIYSSVYATQAYCFCDEQVY